MTIQAQRESDNSLLFQSITLNGVTSNINQRYAPGTAPSGWWGITVNYQMDGNYQADGKYYVSGQLQLHLPVKGRTRAERAYVFTLRIVGTA